MTVEDIADEIINELCWASFFQDIEEDRFGNVERFKIHDLLHDLAQSVTSDTCCIVNDERPIELPKRTRHLTSHLTYHPFEFNRGGSLCQVESLRTVRLQRHTVLLSLDALRSFESLRALVLCHTAISDMLRSSITHFKHLRYLNLARTYVETLPESISSLCNLQVLNLNYCPLLRQLPHRLKCLKALRHLCLRSCRSLSSMSREMGQLTFLRTLNIYIVGSEEGFWLAELGQLCLKGQLHIKNLERVRSAVDAKEANLMGKQLDELFLSWGRNSQSELQQNVEQILEALEPHPKLVSLGVGGYEGSHFPHWMGNPNFENLWYIRLMDCRHSLQLPQMGKLPFLKKLEIHNMNRVQYVDDESYDGGVARGFASLEYLLLSCMPNLERLSKKEGGDMFPCLSELTIVACPKLTFPSVPSVKKLRIAKTDEEWNWNWDLLSGQFLRRHPPTTGSSNQAQLDSIHNLNCLEILCIHDDPELTSLPLSVGRLDNLRGLGTVGT